METISQNILNIISSALMEFALSKIKDIDTYKAVMGLSYYILGEWKKAAMHFYSIKNNFKQWQVKYIMSIGLSLACDDKLSDKDKFIYGNKASELLNDLSHDSNTPEELKAEILIRLGGIKKIAWFAKRKRLNLECRRDNEIDEILMILTDGLEAAKKLNQIKWVDEGLYQFGCTYAMIGEDNETQKYYDALDQESDKGIKLLKRIKERYNPKMDLHQNLKDN